MHPELSLGHAANCRLREPRIGDFAALAAIRRDRMAQEMLLSVPESTDDDAVRDWIDRRTSEACGAFRIVVDDTSGETAGFVQITQVHRRNGTAFGGIALLPQWRARGFGRAALQQLIDLATDELRLWKMLAEIRVDNHASMKLHLSLGYRHIGILDRHFLDGIGTRHDVALVERLLPEARP